MNIPTIGGTRGIFEIFVPGVFLLLNIGAVLYVSPFVDEETKNLILTALSNPVSGLIVAICFGYLIGVLLRLLRVDIPDNLSAAWLRRFSKLSGRGKGQYALAVTETFPYIGWIEEVNQEYLTPNAIQFYKRVWAKRKKSGQNKQFINFCKIIIASNDERAANEIYAAEALTRYIAGMFYALTFAFILILTDVILEATFAGRFASGLAAILLAYFLAIIVIIQNFRRIRIKEVEVIFAASFRNKALFEKDVKESVL
jgi:hypothetical protein